VGDETREGVHTYGWYLKRFITETSAAGATPIVCSLVPRKIWTDGKIARNSQDYGKWAAEAARSGNAPFIDLNETIAREYDRLGEQQVDQLFADEHTHTNRAGAELNAAILVRALRELPLAQFLKAE
jgi:rhamnogalacturonan acetylesterase